MDDKKQKVYDFISSHSLGVISTVSGGEVPHLSAIYVCIEKDLTCCAISKTTSRKFRDIEEGGKASLGFTDEKELTFVELICRAEIVSDTEKKAELLPKIEEIMSSRGLTSLVPPVSQLPGQEHIFICFRPYQISYSSYKDISDSLHVSTEEFRVKI